MGKGGGGTFGFQGQGFRVAFLVAGELEQATPWVPRYLLPTLGPHEIGRYWLAEPPGHSPRAWAQPPSSSHFAGKACTAQLALYESAYSVLRTSYFVPSRSNAWTSASSPSLLRLGVMTSLAPCSLACSSLLTDRDGSFNSSTSPSLKM